METINDIKRVEGNPRSKPVAGPPQSDLLLLFHVRQCPARGPRSYDSRRDHILVRAPCSSYRH